jgi:hypothetical protein
VCGGGGSQRRERKRMGTLRGGAVEMGEERWRTIFLRFLR